MILLQSPLPSTSPLILGFQDTYSHFHIDRFPILNLLQIHIFPKVKYSLECPASPYTSLPHLGAVQQRCLLGDPCLSLYTSICFYLLTILTLKLISPPLFCAFISLTPFSVCEQRRLKQVCESVQSIKNIHYMLTDS